MLYLIQNDAEVPTGSYGELLAANCVAHRLVRADRGEPLPGTADATAVIVLGGAMSVHDVSDHPHLLAVKRLLGELLAADTPLLGICLGGQLLAEVAGGTVASPSPHCELGVHRVELTAAGRRDPLFAGLEEEFVTFQWHRDSFSLPPGATLLAASVACPYQAFRLGAAAWGVQFHPEVTGGIVAAWAGSDAETSACLPEFAAAFAAVEADYLATGRLMLANFLSAAGLCQRLI